MTSMTGPACRELRQLLGVYVVGAIDPAERAYVDAHLAECGACREELAGLAGLPALLGRVPVAEVEQMGEGGYGLPDMAEPPAELLNGLLRRVSARQRSRRWRSVLALAAAVAIAAGGTAAVYQARQPAGSADQSVVQASNAHLTGQVRYSATPWGGTAMQVSVSGIPPHTACRFWVSDAAGRWSVAGAWTTGPGYGQQWYEVSAPMHAADVHGFEITAGRQVLLRIPAA